MLAALTGDTALAFGRLEATADADGTEDMTLRANNHRARAAVHLATGDLEAAHRHASAALAADPSGTNSAAALAIQQRAALWLGDLGRSREAQPACRLFVAAGWQQYG